MKILRTATMTNTGGREGSSTAPDGSLQLRIAHPEDNIPGTTNPEQLFAAAFGACFNSALSSVVLKRARVKADTTVSVSVSFIENAPFDYQLAVAIEGHIDGIPLEQAEEYIQRANEVCPYSKAVRGNIPVTVKAV